MSNTIGPEIKIFEFSFDQEFSYKLGNSDTPWVQTLLDELNENIEAESITENNESFLNIELNIIRHSSPEYKDHLVLDAKISGTYYDSCVRCLENAKMDIKNEFSACFLPDAIKKNEIFRDIETIYISERESDLYFYKARKFDLSELIHEHIYLHKSHFPLHDKNCKGLCGTCGANLNNSLCKH